MKKAFALLVTVVLLISCSVIGFAEDIDFESMDFETLQAMKNALDYEYFSRPESKGISLSPGEYTVGIDIKPGRYYIKTVEPCVSDYTPRVHIYKDKEQFESRPRGYYGEYLYDAYCHLEDDQKSVSLEIGNFIYVESGSILFSRTSINQEDYYVYQVPEGTYVPAGVYKVGEDIPVGKYRVYSGTIIGGKMKIYFKEGTYKSDGSWHLGYDKLIEVDVKPTVVYETVDLEEGYVVLVELDVVMKKQAKLSFD